MKKFSNIRSINRIDPTNHLNCRKNHLCSYIYSIDDNFNLLFPQSLESSELIFKHCYVNKEYRWSYPTQYIHDDDFDNIGYNILRAGKMDYQEFMDAMEKCINVNQPVLFYAPRGYFPYWIDFMKAEGTLPEEYFQLHSFVVCDINDKKDEMLIGDNATKDKSFRIFNIPITLVKEGYQNDPDNWFIDNITVEKNNNNKIKRSEILNKYISYIQSYQDDFKLFDLISNSFEFEIDEFKEKYRPPYINSIALLAGSRLFFSWFIKSTTHSQSLKEMIENNANHLISLFASLSNFQINNLSSTKNDLKSMLNMAKMNEQNAINLIKKEIKTNKIDLILN